MNLETVFGILVVLYSVANLASMGLELNLPETIKSLRSARLVVLTLVWGWVVGPALGAAVNPEMGIRKLIPASIPGWVLIAGGFGFGERIDHPHAGASKPVFVAADHGQIVNQCRRRQEGIEGGHRLQQAQTTALVGHTLVHRQDAISKLGREALEPFLQGPCLG